MRYSEEGAGLLWGESKGDERVDQSEEAVERKSVGLREGVALKKVFRGVQ